MAFNKLVPLGFLFSLNCDMTVAPTRVPATGKALQGLSTPSAGLRKRDVKPEDFRHCFASTAWLGSREHSGSCFLHQESWLPVPWHRKGDKYGARDTWRSSPACPLTWCPGLGAAAGEGSALPAQGAKLCGAAGGTFGQGLSQVPSPV